MHEELLQDIRNLMARRGQVSADLINAHLLVLWYNSTHSDWGELVNSDEGKTWKLWGYTLKNPQE